MDARKLISAGLAALMVAVFVLVVLQKISWLAFWIVSAALLVYVTYVMPSEDAA